MCRGEVETLNIPTKTLEISTNRYQPTGPCQVFKWVIAACTNANSNMIQHEYAPHVLQNLLLQAPVSNSIGRSWNYFSYIYEGSSRMKVAASRKYLRSALTRRWRCTCGYKAQNEWIIKPHLAWLTRLLNHHFMIVKHAQWWLNIGTYR